ncbi:cyclin-I [Onychostoma macrolepis]|uniref:cyclin-I n=1 Tax=Onychostoma macrolepis TaxID=369639 RepID=UPI00272B70B1|nr:cyclin-I [Onychostoma macrolepis]
MKPPGEEENQRLGMLLLNTLARETRLWRAPVLKNGCIQGSDISPPQYHEVIVWLHEMSSVFQFSSETLALGVCVLNSVLATVKTQLKYLKCIAITSLILAAKINEEDEVIASVKDLLEQSRCKFSTAEILRMERVILNKLHWDLYIATPIDFIHIVSHQKSYNPFNVPLQTLAKTDIWSLTLCVWKAAAAWRSTASFLRCILSQGTNLACTLTVKQIDNPAKHLQYKYTFRNGNYTILAVLMNRFDYFSDFHEYKSE